MRFISAYPRESAYYVTQLEDGQVHGHNHAANQHPQHHRQMHNGNYFAVKQYCLHLQNPDLLWENHQKKRR